LGLSVSAWHHFIPVIRHLFVLLTLLVLAGCAHEVRPPAYVAPGPYSGWPPAPTGAARTQRTDWSPPEIAPERLTAFRRAPEASQARLDAPAVSAPNSLPGSIARGEDIAAGEACLDELQQRGVTFEVLEDQRGVDTPVEIREPLGGIRYHTWGDAPLVCDCRLAVALIEIGPQLRAAGVTAARFSGAYVYRTTRSGRRLSLHAHGLAIDIHEFTVDGQAVSVKHDFERGVTGPTCDGLPPVNEVACRVAERGLFRELLTPDDDRDHHDHFHFGLARIED
jgi:hypothetical protein